MEDNNAVAGFLNWHSGIALELMEVAADGQMAHLFGMGASGAINEKYKSDEKYEVWGQRLAKSGYVRKVLFRCDGVRS